MQTPTCSFDLLPRNLCIDGEMSFVRPKAISVLRQRDGRPCFLSPNWGANKDLSIVPWHPSAYNLFWKSILPRYHAWSASDLRDYTNISCGLNMSKCKPNLNSQTALPSKLTAFQGPIADPPAIRNCIDFHPIDNGEYLIAMARGRFVDLLKLGLGNKVEQAAESVEFHTEITQVLFAKNWAKTTAKIFLIIRGDEAGYALLSVNLEDFSVLVPNRDVADESYFIALDANHQIPNTLIGLDSQSTLHSLDIKTQTCVLERKLSGKIKDVKCAAHCRQFVALSDSQFLCGDLRDTQWSTVLHSSDFSKGERDERLQIILERSEPTWIYGLVGDRFVTLVDERQPRKPVLSWSHAMLAPPKFGFLTEPEIDNPGLVVFGAREQQEGRIYQWINVGSVTDLTGNPDNLDFPFLCNRFETRLNLPEDFYNHLVHRNPDFVDSKPTFHRFTAPLRGLALLSCGDSKRILQLTDSGDIFSYNLLRTCEKIVPTFETDSVLQKIAVRDPAFNPLEITTPNMLTAMKPLPDKPLKDEVSYSQYSGCFVFPISEEISSNVTRRIEQILTGQKVEKYEEV